MVRKSLDAGIRARPLIAGKIELIELLAPIKRDHAEPQLLRHQQVREFDVQQNDHGAPALLAPTEN